MVLQAAIDDSVDDETGVYVLAGFIASAETWASFSAEWERILHFAPMNKYGKRQFKMSSMAQSEERMQYLPAFLRVIDDHSLSAISCKINKYDLQSVIKAFHIPGVSIDFAELSNPYIVCFRGLLEMLHSNRAAMSDGVPADAPIDFVFDNQSEGRFINKFWDEYKDKREKKYLFGANPIYRDDADFYPLQAADLLAWWIRKKYKEEFDFRADGPFFPGFEMKNGLNYIQIEMDRESMAKSFRDFIWQETPYDGPIYNVTFGPIDEE